MNKKLLLLTMAISLMMVAGCTSQSTDTQAQNSTKDTAILSYNGGPGPSDPAPILPKTCVDELGGTPVITSLSVSSGSSETEFEIRGCNFVSLDGLFNPWIENSQGAKGILLVKKGNAKLLNVSFRSPLCKGEWVIKGGSGCDDSFILTPGAYKVGVTYVEKKVGDTYQTKKSNEASFTIISTSATEKVVTQPVVKSNKPVITYPGNGSTVNGVTIKGTAKPNSEIWAYVNYPKNELACISINSYASGGASTVDSKGNFEFALAEPCSKELAVVVSTEEPAADKTGACRSSENISEPITFTNSGKLPGICNQ